MNEIATVLDAERLLLLEQEKTNKKKKIIQQKENEVAVVVWEFVDSLKETCQKNLASAITSKNFYIWIECNGRSNLIDAKHSTNKINKIL